MGGIVGPLVSQARCDRAKLLSSIHGEATVLMLTGLSSGTLYRIKKRGWQAIPKGFRLRPRPTDFAIQERHCNSQVLSLHYGTSNATIARWRRELREKGR